MESEISLRGWVMLPEGWKLGRVEDVIDSLESGISVNGEDRPKKCGEIGVLKISSVTYGKFNAEKYKTVISKDIKRAKLNPKRGQILISRSNTYLLVGASCYLDKDYSDLFLPDKLWQTVTNKGSNVNTLWLSYLLASSQVRYRLSNLATGTSSSMKNITKGELLTLSINIPPSNEQRKIALILSTWDKAISSTEALIDNSKQQKKALMQELLTGKKRLAGFEGAWEEVKLGSLGAIYSGGTPSTSNKEYWNGDIDWVTPTDITRLSGSHIRSSARKISEEGLRCSSAKLVPKGSLLVCTRATIGEMAITSHDMSTNQGFKNIVPSKDSVVEFLYYLLTHEKHKLVSKACGSTFLELSKTTFEGLEFKVPAYKEQQKIAAVLTNADKEIDLLEQQLTDLKQEKKALMQQLLTGKRRVKTETNNFEKDCQNV